MIGLYDTDAGTGTVRRYRTLTAAPGAPQTERVASGGELCPFCDGSIFRPLW